MPPILTAEEWLKQVLDAYGIYTRGSYGHCRKNGHGPVSATISAEELEARDRDVRRDERRKIAEEVMPEAKAFLDNVAMRHSTVSTCDEIAEVFTSVTVADIQTLIAVRRQALLDAAKEVCPYCHVNRQFGKGIWSKYHVFDDGSRQPCCAEHIHTLLTKPDAEVQSNDVRCPHELCQAKMMDNCLLAGVPGGLLYKCWSCGERFKLDAEAKAEANDGG